MTFVAETNNTQMKLCETIYHFIDSLYTCWSQRCMSVKDLDLQEKQIWEKKKQILFLFLFFSQSYTVCLSDVTQILDTAVSHLFWWLLKTSSLFLLIFYFINIILLMNYCRCYGPNSLAMHFTVCELLLHLITVIREGWHVTLLQCGNTNVGEFPLINI